MRFARVVKQIDRCERGQHADESGESHKFQIMGSRDAIINLEHEQSTTMAGNTAIAEKASGNYVRRGERELRARKPLIPYVVSLLLRRRRLSVDYASVHVSAAEFQDLVIGA
jgi:hypothetical protein